MDILLNKTTILLDTMVLSKKKKRHLLCIANITYNCILIFVLTCSRFKCPPIIGKLYHGIVLNIKVEF